MVVAVSGRVGSLLVNRHARGGESLLNIVAVVWQCNMKIIVMMALKLVPRFSPTEIRIRGEGEDTTTTQQQLWQ